MRKRVRARNQQKIRRQPFIQKPASKNPKPAKIVKRKRERVAKKRADRQGFQNHFREGKAANNDHPAYVVGSDGDKYKFLTLTHARSYKGKNNILLKQNPESKPIDKRPSYLTTKPRKSKKVKFGSRLSGWKFKKSDKKKIKRTIKPKKKKGR